MRTPIATHPKKALPRVVKRKRSPYVYWSRDGRIERDLINDNDTLNYINAYYRHSEGWDLLYSPPIAPRPSMSLFKILFFYKIHKLT